MKRPSTLIILLGLLGALMLLPGVSSTSWMKDEHLPDWDYYPVLKSGNHPVHQAKILYRTIRRCSDDSVVSAESKLVLNLPDGTRYKNYVCGSRKAELCAGDGSRDTWYDEWCEDARGAKLTLKSPSASRLQ